MEIAVIGTGYVGLVSGTCFADAGNNVVCVDTNAEKINRLVSGDIPIFEPGLRELVKKNRARLTFTTDIEAALRKGRSVLSRSEPQWARTAAPICTMYSRLRTV